MNNEIDIREINASTQPRVSEFPRHISELPFASGILNGITVGRMLADSSKHRDPFWDQVKLYGPGQGNEGASYGLVPSLQFGVDFQDGEPTMKIPNVAFVNSWVDNFNPGGFKFEIDEGIIMDPASTYLDRLSRRRYPASLDDTTVTPLYDHFYSRAFNDDALEGVEPGAQFYNLALSEHDMVDHLGVILVPPGEASKLSDLAQAILDTPAFSALDSQKFRADATGLLDRVMDVLASYMIAPDATGGEVASYKDRIWEFIEDGIAQLHVMTCMRKYIVGSTMQIRFHHFDAAHISHALPGLIEGGYIEDFRLNRDALDAAAREAREIDATESYAAIMSCQPGLDNSNESVMSRANSTLGIDAGGLEGKLERGEELDFDELRFLYECNIPKPVKRVYDYQVGGSRSPGLDTLRSGRDVRSDIRILLGLDPDDGHTDRELQDLFKSAGLTGLAWSLDLEHHAAH